MEKLPCSNPLMFNVDITDVRGSFIVEIAPGCERAVDERIGFPEASLIKILVEPELSFGDADTHDVLEYPNIITFFNGLSMPVIVILLISGDVLLGS